MSRREWPGPQKLIDLCRRQGFQATVNLPVEMTAGARRIIGKAGLASGMETYHIRIVYMEAPKLAQVLELLDLLTGPGPVADLTSTGSAGNRGNGVMTACYRMAVMGWTAIDAVTEARNFGCVIPGQLAFIRMFGARLAEGYEARAALPAPGRVRAGPVALQPPGSVRATPRELATVIAAVARPEEGQPREGPQSQHHDSPADLWPRRARLPIGRFGLVDIR